jgi:3-hydroxyisobutyrate dehydrogenase
VAEAAASSVALARRLGLDTENVMEALAGSPLVSAWQAAKLQRIAKDDFPPSSLCRSRSRTYASPCRRPARTASPPFACLADEWQQVVDQGLGDRDITVVTLTLQRQGGSP